MNFRRVLNAWLKAVDVLGTVQMMIILTILYWLLVTPLGLIMPWFEDPLSSKKPSKTNWHERTSPSGGTDFFKDQG
jgi:hypothetical protein